MSLKKKERTKDPTYVRLTRLPASRPGRGLLLILDWGKRENRAVQVDCAQLSLNGSEAIVAVDETHISP